ncbi:MAG: DUF2062 domain-containing protein [Verrucomicrobiota bacterium]|jgi:uncharacterized protein (DUF2062 family)
MNPQRWFQEHSLKLLAIRDTPEAIAGGVAIGIFIGFTPLFGLKTILTILFAWLTGSNIIAAVIASAAHDVLLPLMPAVFRLEYDVGFWLLSQPHHLPPPLVRMHLQGHWRHWTTFFTVGKPLLVGSAVCAAPFALLSYVLTQRLVARHQRKKKPQAPPATQNPS